jgi:hypothetical protein
LTVLSLVCGVAFGVLPVSMVLGHLRLASRRFMPCAAERTIFGDTAGAAAELSAKFRQA